MPAVLRMIAILKHLNLMAKFYFTFGFGQRYENCYHVIEADSYGEARQRMVDKFGLKWSFQYTEDKWILPNGKTQAEEYHLREIK